jgi:hypothetical protein
MPAKCTHKLVAGNIYKGQCRRCLLDLKRVYYETHKRLVGKRPHRPRTSDQIVAVDGMKVCCRCRSNLPVSAFHRRTQSPDGYNYYCKDCANFALSGTIAPKVNDHVRQNQTSEDQTTVE